MDNAFQQLKEMFADIDKDGSNRLRFVKSEIHFETSLMNHVVSRLEFEALMDKLDINFSRKRWKQIYREIDRNFDDQVSFDEFILFLFPDNDLSKVSFVFANIVKSYHVMMSIIVQ
jgi:hypothetical protein